MSRPNAPGGKPRTRANVIVGALIAAVLAAGCGAQAAATRTTPTTGTMVAAVASQPAVRTKLPTSEFAGRAGRQQFVRLLNSICSVVRSRAPRPLAAHPTGAEVKTYVAQAVIVARATVTSLQRVPTPPSERAMVRHLINGYQALERMYRAVAILPVSDVRASMTMNLAEARLTAQATRADLVACSPHGGASFR